MCSWPSSVSSFPYLPREKHKTRYGKVWDKITSYSGIIPWPKGMDFTGKAKCSIKIYGFWTDPETEITHISLMSNDGYDKYSGPINPHNSLKRPFCGSHAAKDGLPRCQWVYKGRPNCPVCIRTFEKSMESHERYLTRYRVDTASERT